jgi:tetratricopeptide (TPR) repeat protein
MRIRGARILLAAAALSCLAFAACASAHRQVNKVVVKQQATVDVDRALASGDYQRALDLLKKHYQKDPADKNLLSKYVGTIEEFKSTADGFRDKGEYDKAAGIYQVLLDNWGRFTKLEIKLTFGRAGILAKLKSCQIVVPTEPPARREVRARGDHQSTLELLKKRYQDEPGDKNLLSDYVGAVEEIKKAADGSRDKGNYSQATGTYRLLLDSWAGFSWFEEKLPFRKADVQAGVKDCRVGLVGIQARQELGAGNYEKALTTYQAALHDYPGDKTLKDGYAGVAAALKAAGAKAFAAKDYAQAGKEYSLLLKYSAPPGGSGAATDSNRKEMDEAVKLCSSNLTKRGLAEYRKGNLDKAIAAWESLLVFDPDNVEIKKAVETARAQLGKLKSLAPGGGVDPSRAGR